MVVPVVLAAGVLTTAGVQQFGGGFVGSFLASLVRDAAWVKKLQKKNAELEARLEKVEKK